MVYNGKDACAIMCADEVVTLVQQASGQAGLQLRWQKFKHLQIYIQITAISSSGPPGLRASVPGPCKDQPLTLSQPAYRNRQEPSSTGTGNNRWQAVAEPSNRT